MSADVEKDLAVHEAICTERYNHIFQMLKDGDKRMTKIEYLLYGVMVLVLLGPGVAGTFFKHFFGV